MRIGLFTDAYLPYISGVVTSVCLLREELIKLGHQVYVITVKAPGDEDVNDDDTIIRLPSVPFKKWKDLRVGLPISPKLNKTIKNLELDIIHTHSEFSIGLLGRYFSRNLKIPHVHTYHTMYEDYTHFIYSLKPGKKIVKKIVKKTVKLFLKDLDAVIAPTLKTKNALLSYGIKNKIYILPTGIDLEKFKEVSNSDPMLKKIREKYNILPSEKILLYLGRVSEEKSIDKIIKALSILTKRGLKTRLLIVGAGPYLKDLKALCDEENILDKVIFTGMVPQEDVKYYYSIASTFVNASKTETQGLTILEAMVSKTPIVVFNDENIDGLVEDNISGRLFSNETELLDSIESALIDTNLNNKLIQNAYISAQKLSKEEYSKGAEEIYNKLRVQLHHKNIQN